MKPLEPWLDIGVNWGRLAKIWVTTSCRTGCRVAAGSSVPNRKKFEILAHEADEPNALVDLLDAKFPSRQRPHNPGQCDTSQSMRGRPARLRSTCRN
jgi:hypothetical protein